ncbi:hypothetical protein FEE95_10695 [Maribacter algarum]|uniref:Lipocalin-like domain-containing protein n=1 Tax=Maribacter algarum (ex Zhang et al. 2020) TaxID=2578118 RepID=A0A5S3PQI8_9FLAO|nr:hypothetical protein [Maribacter algarum]TMM56954.1 hypothetical protein FEE95_10695 [Maribacter algarum]
MKTRTDFRFPMLLSFALLLIMTTSCTTEDVIDENSDPIIGKWFLTTVNDTDVANVDCYRESFVESDAETITFFIQDRLENGTCETVLDNTTSITNEEGFYYLGNEVIEIYIEGNELSWRVDKDTSLIFRK